MTVQMSWYGTLDKSGIGGLFSSLTAKEMYWLQFAARESQQANFAELPGTGI